MKRYFMGVLLLILLVAVLGLPPRHAETAWWAGNRSRTPERARYLELREELVKASWLYQRIQWRDSVSGVLQKMDRERAFVVQAPPAVPGPLLARVDSGVSLHLRAVEAIPPQVPVGVFLIPNNTDLHPSAPRTWTGGAWNRREFFIARGSEDPFCALVEPVAREGIRDLETVVERLVFLPRNPQEKPNTLRICGYYARYGPPGEEVERWLRRGASEFASGVNRDGRQYLPPFQGIRGVFGRISLFTGISLRGMACLGSSEPACEAAFLLAGPSGQEKSPLGSSPRFPPEDSPVDFFANRYGRMDPDFGSLDGFLLPALEEEFGPDRFRRFWKSDRPVLQAFQSAFEVPAGRWTGAWTRGYLGTVDRGPTVPLTASVISLATVGLFALAAGFTGRRRN